MQDSTKPLPWGTAQEALKALDAEGDVYNETGELPDPSVLDLFCKHAEWSEDGEEARVRFPDSSVLLGHSGSWGESPDDWEVEE